MAQAAQDLADFPISYWEYGSGDTTIVIIHGGPGITHDYLRPEWDWLGSSYRLVYYDQRGCGESDEAQSYTWQAHLTDLNLLVNRMRRDGAVVLAGSSWGAHLALLYASEYPGNVEALVLSGFTPWESLRPKSVSNRMPMDSLALLFGYDSVEAFKEFLGPREQLSDEERFTRIVHSVVADTSLQQRLLTTTRFCSDVHSETLESLIDMPALGELPSLDVPVLAFGRTNHGDFHPDGTAELHTHLPALQVIKIESAGHDPWFTESGQFFSAISSFVKSLGMQETTHK